MGEFELIDWIRARTPSANGVLTGIGDDCAWVSVGPERASLLITSDLLVDGRHFRLSECGPVAAGRKAMGANLSDIAAMAGTPRYAVVAVALPHNGAEVVAKGVHEGLVSIANDHGTSIVGGDTNAWDGPLVISLTLLGEPHEKGPIFRSGARVGDILCVTGPLGGSILGRHLTPKPRLSEARALADTGELRSMIDLSDGLASDLGHILAASGGVGATLFEELVPIHRDAELLSRTTGRTTLAHALSDGEDFELCVAVSPAFYSVRDVREQFPWLIRIGVIEAEPGVRLRAADGIVRRIDIRGFDQLTT
jgi:thiamine-monophosphate kinase